MAELHSGTEGFGPRVQAALRNPQVRGNLRKAMDGLVEKRAIAFSDWEIDALRELGASVRLRTLTKLPELLEQLEERLHSNDVHVHWAQTGEQACDIVRSICQQRQARSVIKGKSMVTEEIGLNAFLEGEGLEVLESDLGEYIIQLAQETPSHIIMPAIHKNTAQISELMHVKTGTQRSEDVDYLTSSAREQLREKFMQADVGITGVNFAVAETGTLCLVENEGNGRMTSSVPKCHIAVTGIEKVVESLEDIAPLLALLTRSATGQSISTYVNLISSPRKVAEKDGPEEVHLVLVDAGRSDIYQDPELRDTLRCIRCGACMNHCPVYTRIGGHAYGTTYPGPIGKILMPQLQGLEQAAELSTACTLCGACEEVCPVKIPIPQIIQRIRTEAMAGEPERIPIIQGYGSKRRWREIILWRGWSYACRSPKLYRSGTKLLSRCRALLPKKVGPWTQCREAPKVAPKSLHQLMKEREAG